MSALPRCTGSCHSGRQPCACATGIVHVGMHAERATRRFLTAAAVMAVVTLCLLTLAACGGSSDPIEQAPDCSAPGASALPQCVYDNPQQHISPPHCAASGVCS